MSAANGLSFVFGFAVDDNKIPFGKPRNDSGEWRPWTNTTSRRNSFPGEIVRRAAAGEKGASLRTQLEQLRAEAEGTRSKADSARRRRLRLMEAAEQLQKQAISNVRSGREDDARDLLLQKRKIMKALEKSKNRIELFDELYRKLGEEISLKEAQLIGNVAMQPPFSSEDTDTPVRIVSPKVSHVEEAQAMVIFEQKDSKTEDIQEEVEKDRPSDSRQNWQVQPFFKGKPSIDTNRESNINFLMGITSYKDFLEHVDKQLTSIEDDFLIVLRLSTLMLGKEQKESTNMMHTSDLLRDISSIRDKIDGIIRSTPDLS